MKYLLVSVAAMLFQSAVFSQDTSFVRARQFPATQANRLYRSAVESLQLETVQLRNQNDSLLLLLNNEASRVNLQDIEIKDLKESIDALKSKLEEAKGDQLQTSHTSSVLLVFNIIAAVILLIALFWFYLRKKSPQMEYEEPVLKNEPIVNKDFVETRMERLEKLGRLRDKGLLTEEEFQLQKKQILD